MRHTKRQLTPKTWPIPRKGTKFITKVSSNGIPVVIALRDILKIAKTKKEVKKAAYQKLILVCGKEVKNEKKNIEFMDTLTIKPAKKSYRLEFNEFGKFKLEEIKEKDSFSKVSKIKNKKILKGKKTQLNLSDGRNYLSEIKCLVNDSVLIDLKNNKITKCLSLKEKSNVVVIGGKHTGKKGIINKMIAERKMAEVDVGNDKFNVLIKQLMVIE